MVAPGAEGSLKPATRRVSAARFDYVLFRPYLRERIPSADGELRPLMFKRRLRKRRALSDLTRLLIILAR